MKVVDCPRVQEVERALQDERIEHVETHLGECLSCRQLVRVASWMKDLARMRFDHALPDPVQLWWKAQLLQRWDAERRAEAPLDAMQHVEMVAGAIGSAVFLYFLWPLVGSSSWLTGGATGTPGLTTIAPSAFTSVLAVGGTVLGLLTLALLHRVVSED
jgi:predicted anti-sigma-YlaC factor YlaD